MTKLLKYLRYLGIAYLALFGIGSVALAASIFTGALPINTAPQPVTTLQVSATSTDTITIPSFKIFPFPSDYKQQGTCLDLIDADNGSHEYLTIHTGTLTISHNSCL